MLSQEQILAVIRQIEERYPNIDFRAFFEADKALNAELWHGPLPLDYWTYSDPLEHYIWQGVEKACDDIREMLSELPTEIWIDLDCDCVVYSDPNEDEHNWHYDSEDDAPVWVGSEDWSNYDPRELLMFTESYRQAF